MTQISILNGDFEILFDDEKNQNGGTLAVAGMRTVQHTGASTTVYTTNQLYSAVADAADDFVAMGFRNPMLPTTPNAYTMENKYFIPRSSTQYLKEGSITANYALAGSVEGDGVLRVPYSGGTNFVAGDIGRRVRQNTTLHVGTLLDFDIDQDGTLVAWIRPNDPSTDTFSGTAGIEVTNDGGTGSSTANVAGTSGETIYSAIQAIGSVPTATEVYLYQNRLKVQSWDGTFQWWTTDPSVSLGIISILIPVKDSGTFIADGDVEVFARRYTALYDNFRLRVQAGGFSALPLASAADINNTTGYTNSGTLSGVGGSATVGNAIYAGPSWAAATAKGVITAVNGSTDIDWYLIGDLSTIGSTTAITGYDFVTQANDGFTATTGTTGDTSGGPTDPAAGEGGTVTIALGGFDVDHTGDGTTEPYSIRVDCQGNVPIAKVYERLKYITRRGATADLITGMNVPGESYRGLDGIIEYDNPAGDLTEGDDVNVNGGTWTARLLHQNTTNSPTYITVTDQQTSIDAVVNDDFIWDETQNASDQVQAANANFGIVGFTSPKSSPFGTFTGTQIFGARGVAYINPNTGDEQSYTLTDDLGNLNTPPNTVSFTVTNTAAGDRVLVARDTGTSGVIDKDQHGGLVAAGGDFNGVGDSKIHTDNVLDNDVPQVGYVRIVDNTNQEEHHYVYSSITRSIAGPDGLFTLKAIPNATVTTGDTADANGQAQLIASGATFVTSGVEIGMLVRNTLAAKRDHVWEVVSVDSETQLTCVQLFGPDLGDASMDFDVSDVCEINKLIGRHDNDTTPTDYGTGDDVYDLILDLEATGTSVSNNFTKDVSPATFGTVVNVRQGKVILPFTLNQTQGQGSTTVTVVRQPDTIAT